MVVVLLAPRFRAQTWCDLVLKESPPIILVDVREAHLDLEFVFLFELHPHYSKKGSRRNLPPARFVLNSSPLDYLEVFEANSRIKVANKTFSLS